MRALSTETAQIVHVLQINNEQVAVEELKIQFVPLVYVLQINNEQVAVAELKIHFAPLVQRAVQANKDQVDVMAL